MTAGQEIEPGPYLLPLRQPCFAGNLILSTGLFHFLTYSVPHFLSKLKPLYSYEQRQTAIWMVVQFAVCKDSARFGDNN